MFPIVAKNFTPDGFAAYARQITMLPAFRPRFVVLHNTGSPTLAQRPEGFSEAHMRNLQSYYANDMKWSGGPHLFIDDVGIWVFNPLDRRGTHSPSWNPVSWGIEMLGDYNTETFTTGRGAKVRANAIAAFAVLLGKIAVGASDTTIRLHKEDSETTHKDCPGANVIKADFVEAVRMSMIVPVTPVAVMPPPTSSKWTVIIEDKSRMVDSTDTALVRWVSESLGATVDADSASRRITILTK